MIDVYWGCLIAGILFGLLSLLFGDGLGDAIDSIGIDGLDFLHPMTLVGGVTVFGGVGIMLHDYTGLRTGTAALVAAAAAVIFAIVAFFAYVRPMRRTESSLGYSIRELVGRPASVSIPIPANGHGEVRVSFGDQATYQIASSYNGEPIATDESVVIVEVGDGEVLVARSELDR